MPFTERLRQHHELATLTTRQLRNLVRLHRPGDDAIAIATQLARLQSLLRIHLAEGDQSLYRALIATKDGVAVALARQYQTEMGSLAWDLEEFMRRWSSSAMIALDFAAFEIALDALLAALAARIECENVTLYPIADALLLVLQGKAA